MSEYADAVRDFDLADASLRQAFAKPEPPVYLPAPLPAAVVHQPVPLPEPRPRVDVPSMRLASTGICAIGVGGGVYLGGLGIHEAGPYLPWVAASLAALAAAVAALKSKTGGPSSGTTVNFNGGKNRVRNIR